MEREGALVVGGVPGRVMVRGAHPSTACLEQREVEREGAVAQRELPLYVPAEAIVKEPVARLAGSGARLHQQLVHTVAQPRDLVLGEA